MAREYPKFLGSMTVLRAEQVINGEIKRLLAEQRETARTAAVVRAENDGLLAELNAILPANDQFDAVKFRAKLKAGPTDKEYATMVAAQEARQGGE